MGLLDGKAAIVTGSGGGIGRSHALALAKEGAKIVINDVGGDRSGTGAYGRQSTEGVSKEGMWTPKEIAQNIQKVMGW